MSMIPHHLLAFGLTALLHHAINNTDAFNPGRTGWPTRRNIIFYAHHGKSHDENIIACTPNNNNNADRVTTNSTTTNLTANSTDSLAILPQLFTYKKPRQKRRAPTRQKKPPNYWHSIDNLRHELSLFWEEELQVPLEKINSNQPPPIPSELILNRFERNDLRWGIAQMGGRETVSHLLGGAMIIPGKWKDAKELEVVKYYVLPLIEGKEGDVLIKQKHGTKRKQMQQLQTKDVNNIQQSYVKDEISLSSTLINNNNMAAPGKVEGRTRQAMSTSTQFTGEKAVEDERLIDMVITDNSTSMDLNYLNKVSKKEFWSKELAVQQLYLYLETYKIYKHRPAVWMPQLAELSQEGYSKLFNACSRFKKLPRISVFSYSSNTTSTRSRGNWYGDDSCLTENNHQIYSMAGLIPFKEWRFFESQLQLFVELRNYLREYHDGSEEYFPDPLEVLSHDHTQLYELIRIHGGKVLLARKLDMKIASNTGPMTSKISDMIAKTPQSDVVKSSMSTTISSNLNWGPLTLDFAIQLLHFIRLQFLLMSPPLLCPVICMPSEKDLLRCGRDELALQVVKFGGYENVARRLGLAFFDGKSRRMEEHIFRGAKRLWKERNVGRLLRTDSYRTKGAETRKEQGLAWNQELVVEELRSYTNANMTPSVYMPKFSHFDEHERGDLKNAISKFGGADAICNATGLIPYTVWSKFELLLELLTELSRYRDYLVDLNKTDVIANIHNNSESNPIIETNHLSLRGVIIPTKSQITTSKFHHLSHLIRLFGGRKRIQDRLIGSHANNILIHQPGYQHIHFDVDFYIQLATFIKTDMLTKEPPVPCNILMPTADHLTGENRTDLVQTIEKNGGFEVIAKRLGVAVQPHNL